MNKKEMEKSELNKRGMEKLDTLINFILGQPLGC